MTCSEAREYLFAFLDGELDARLSIELQRHLEHCPACAHDAEIERTIRRQLECDLCRIGMEPAWERPVSRAPAAAPGTGAPARRIAVRAAAGLAAMVAVFISAWVAVRALRPAPQPNVFADLVTDFDRFVGGEESVRLASNDPQAVASWLHTTTSLKVEVPPSPGPQCRLVGGRDCRIRGKAAAFVLYDFEGTPASLFAFDARDAALLGLSAAAARQTIPWVQQLGEHTVVVCPRDDVVYAAVSTLPSERLLVLLNCGAESG